jgi:hypothetical protein
MYSLRPDLCNVFENLCGILRGRGENRKRKRKGVGKEEETAIFRLESSVPFFCILTVIIQSSIELYSIPGLTLDTSACLCTS